MNQTQNFNNYEVAFIPQNISNISSGRHSSDDLRQSSDSNIFVNQFKNQNSKSKIEPIKQDELIIFQSKDQPNNKDNLHENFQNFMNDLDSQQFEQSEKNNNMNMFSSSHNSILEIKQYQIRDFPKNQVKNQTQQIANQIDQNKQVKNNEHFVYGPKHFQLNSPLKKKYSKPFPVGKDSINQKQKQSYNLNKKVKSSKSPEIKNIQNAASKIPFPLSLSIYSSYSSQQQQHNDQHTFTQRMTQTDVISEQKEQFLQEEVQSADMNSQMGEKNKEINYKDNYIPQNIKFDNKKSVKNFQPKITIVKSEKYDQKEIQQNALYNNLLSSYNFLELQIKDLIMFNRANQIQLEKQETKQNIIKNQIYNNELKIFLRKAQETKHINFCTDFQYNRQRCKFLNVRKKVDNKLRLYCQELQSKIKLQQEKQTKLQKELKILQFYYQDFKKKVNFSYIFKQRKIQELIQQAKEKVKKKNNRKLYKSRSSNKSQKLMLNKKKSSGTQSNGSINSITSIQNKRAVYQFSSSSQGMSLFQIQSEWQNGSKINQLGIKLNQNQHQTKIKKTFDDYEHISQRFNQVKNNQNQYYCQTILNKGKLKKYFYYQCQQNLKQMLEQLYFNNQEINQLNLKYQPKILSKNHRKILFNKMSLIQNQILDLEVDTKQKIKQMQKQNQILRKQQQVLGQMIYKVTSQNPEEINKVKQIKQKKTGQLFKNMSKLSNSKSQSRFSATKLKKQVKSNQFLLKDNQNDWNMKLTKKINFNKVSLDEAIITKNK